MKAGKIKTGLFLGNLVFSFVVSMIIINIGEVSSNPTAKIFVDPKTSIAEPGETFVINVNISEVTDLMIYDVRIDFDSTILFSDYTMLKEGPFLNSSGDTTWTPSSDVGYVEGACEFVEVMGASGSGTLFNATFQVLAKGKSNLALTVSSLLDTTWSPITYETEDGVFYTRSPTAVFTYRPEKETVVFNASESVDYNGHIVSYEWDFNDSVIVTETDPVVTHVYAAGGKYNVTLTVTDNETLTDTAWRLVSLATVYVDPPSRDIERGDTFTVDIKIANVTGLSSWQVRVKWDQDILYTNDTLVTEGPFLSDVGETLFVKKWPPYDVQPPAKLQVGCMLMVTGSASGDGTLARITFIVKPNAKGKTAIDIFDTGLFDIDVLPIAHSSIDSLVKTIYPVASFIFNYTDKLRRNPVINQVITFNATKSYDPNGNIVSYKWDFGDGNTTTETDPIITHTYAQNDTYQISLTVFDSEGLNDTVSESEDGRKVIVVDVRAGIPTAEFRFDPERPLVDERVTFDALESRDVPPGNLTKYRWSFGDGSGLNSTIPIQTHVYRKSGSYVVNLTVFDNENNTNVRQHSITVGLHELIITSTTINQTTAKTGQPINITATIMNSGTFTETFNATIYYDGNEIETLELIKLYAESRTNVTLTWNTTNIQAGSYIIEALITSVPYERDTSNNIYIAGIVTIEKWASTISMDLTKKTVKVDESVVINGSLNPVQANVNITISYSLNGGSWVDITTQTNSNGEYAHRWTPNEAGIYIIKASWVGDERTLQAVSEIKALVVETAELISPTVLYVGVGVALIVVAAVVIYLMRGRFRKS